MAHRWLERLSSLSASSLPYAKGLATFVCKHMGLPGGALIADAIGGAGQVRTAAKLEKLDQLLGVVFDQGQAILRRLEAEELEAAALPAALEALVAEDARLRGDLEAMAAELRALPGMQRFLAEGLAEVVDEIRALGGRVEQVSGQVTELSDDLGAVGDQLAAGQRELLRELHREFQELRARLSLQARVRPGDSLSIRSETERRQVRTFLAQVRDLPPALRSSPQVLSQEARILVAAGDAGAAAERFAAAALGATDATQRGRAHFDRFQALVQADQLEAAAEAYREAIALDPELELFDSERFPRVLKILGTGAFGIAFLCVDQVGEERVIKALVGELDADQVFREAEILREIRSPFVARVFAWGWSDRRQRRGPYIVTEFAGRPLSAVVAEAGPLPLREALPVLGGIAAGLEAAHAAGVVHRDVKPENVLLRRNKEGWSPRVIDFGLGIETEALEGYRRSVSSSGGGAGLLAQQITGTLKYAPPEQTGELAHPVGPHSDVYAFGRTANYLLFGRTQLLGSDWRKLPTEVADLLERCQQRAPADRFPDFARVREALDLLTPGLDLAGGGARPPQTPAAPAAPDGAAGQPAAAVRAQREELVRQLQVAYASQDQTGAESVARALLRLEIAHWGEESAEALRSRASLAELVQAQGRLGEARELWSDLLATRRRLLGDASLDVVQARVRVARVAEDEGREADALHELTLAFQAGAELGASPQAQGALQRRISELRAALVGPEREARIRELAGQLSGDAERDDPLYAQLYACVREVLPEEHALSVEQLSFRWPPREETLRLAESVYGALHPLCQTLIQSRARWEREAGKAMAAEARLSALVDALAPGPHSPPEQRSCHFRAEHARFWSRVGANSVGPADEARWRELATSLGVSQGAGDRATLLARGNHALARLCLGQEQAAEASLPGLIADWEALGEPHNAAELQAGFGEHFERQGDRHRAGRYFADAGDLEGMRRCGLAPPSDSAAARERDAEAARATEREAERAAERAERQAWKEQPLATRLAQVVDPLIQEELLDEHLAQIPSERVAAELQALLRDLPAEEPFRAELEARLRAAGGSPSAEEPPLEKGACLGAFALAVGLIGSAMAGVTYLAFEQTGRPLLEERWQQAAGAAGVGLVLALIFAKRPAKLNESTRNSAGGGFCCLSLLGLLLVLGGVLSTMRPDEEDGFEVIPLGAAYAKSVRAPFIGPSAGATLGSADLRLGSAERTIPHSPPRVEVFATEQDPHLGLSFEVNEDEQSLGRKVTLELAVELEVTLSEEVLRRNEAHLAAFDKRWSGPAAKRLLERARANLHGSRARAGRGEARGTLSAVHLQKCWIGPKDGGRFAFREFDLMAVGAFALLSLLLIVLGYVYLPDPEPSA